MESIYIKLDLYRSKNECAKTDNFFSPISEVYNGTDSLFRNTLIQTTGIKKNKLHMYINTIYINTEIQMTEIQK